MYRPPTGKMAIFANPDGGRTIVFRFDIHSAMPVSRVPMPSVTTMVFTRATTTSRPLTTPQASAPRTATTAPAHTGQWWLVTSTGRIVAAKPNTEGTDRSTNSPTMIVHSSAMVMNTSAYWPLKIDSKDERVMNTPGLAIVYTTISSAQTPSTAYRDAKCRIWRPAAGRADPGGGATSPAAPWFWRAAFMRGDPSGVVICRTWRG